MNIFSSQSPSLFSNKLTIISVFLSNLRNVPENSVEQRVTSVNLASKAADFCNKIQTSASISRGIVQSPLIRWLLGATLFLETFCTFTYSTNSIHVVK